MGAVVFGWLSTSSLVMKLKKALALLLIAPLSGCGVFQTAGIKYYEPVVKVDKYGNRYQKHELVANINTDLPGVTSIDVGKLHIKFSDRVMTCQEAVYDRKGNYVATLNQTYLSGAYPSHNVTAQGAAGAKLFDSGAAGATGILATVIGTVATGGVLAGIPK